MYLYSPSNLVREDGISIVLLSIILIIMFLGSFVIFNSSAYSYYLHPTNYANQVQDTTSLGDATINLVDDGNNTFSDLSRNLTASNDDNSNNPSNDDNSNNPSNDTNPQ